MKIELKNESYIILINNFKQIFLWFSFCPPSLVLGLLWYELFSQAPIEIKIIFPKANKFSIL